MKMLFLLNVSEAGTISLTKGSSNIVIEAGEKLGSLVLDDPSLVAKAAPYLQGVHRAALHGIHAHILCSVWSCGILPTSHCASLSALRRSTCDRAR